MTSRSQDQIQGHEGHYRFFADFARFSRTPPTDLIGECWRHTILTLGSAVFFFLMLHVFEK